MSYGIVGYRGKSRGKSREDRHRKDGVWLHVKCPCDNLNNCPGHQEGIREVLCPYKGRLPPAGVAQSVEHLICNQRVGGSIPFASSRKTRFRKQKRFALRRALAARFQSTPSDYFPASEVVRREFSHSFPELRSTESCRCWFFARPGSVFGFAQVGEWLKPTDCKSVPLRRYGGSNPPLCTRVAKLTVECKRS